MNEAISNKIHFSKSRFQSLFHHWLLFPEPNFSLFASSQMYPEYLLSMDEQRPDYALQGERVQANKEGVNM